MAEVDKLRHDMTMSDLTAQSNTAKKGKVAFHEAKVFVTLRGKPGQWLTNDDIARDAGVKPRTARQYTARCFKHGLLERAETFPAYKFRWVTVVGEPSAYQKRIEAALEPFGLG